MVKKLLFTLFLISFLGLGFATHQDRDVTVKIKESDGDVVETAGQSTYSVGYGDSNPLPFRVRMFCNGGDCPTDNSGDLIRNPLYFKLCNTRTAANDEFGNTAFGLQTSAIDIPRNGDLLIENFKCGPGDHIGYIVDGSSHVVKTIDPVFEVDYKTSGKNLKVGINPEVGSDKVTDFNFKDNLDAGKVIIKVSGLTVGDNTFGKYANSGVILSSLNTGEGYVDSVNEMLDAPYSGSEDDCGQDVSFCNVAQKEFQSLPSSCGPGRCPLGHRLTGGNPNYIPRGEIILGKSFDPDQSTWPNSLGEDQRFYVCDSQMDGVSGTSMEGKTVYSPGSNFETDYFECRNDQWKPRTQCDPGFAWERKNGEYQCVQQPGSVVNAEYFNIQRIPRSKFTSSFKAGFKIPGDEAADFEEQYNANLRKVQAECWMGNEDARPSSSSQKGVITVDAEQFEINSGDPIWVLMDIPHRENVNNKTYSCMYGFRGYGDRTIIMQAVNHYGLNSTDTNRENMQYSQIKEKYQNNAGAYTSGLNVGWHNFGSYDGRELDFPNSNIAALDPLWTPYKEYPYCPPIISSADIIC